MAHQILGNRFAQAYGRSPAWHRIQGAVVNPGGTLTEAVQAIAPDLYMEKAPLMAYSYSKQVWVPVQDQYAIFRPGVHDDQEDRVFGIVGKDYELLQMGEFAQILDPLAAQKQLETVGILHNGKEIFCAFADGGFKANGDDIFFYHLFRNVQDGKSGLEYYETDVRAVCANTVAMAISASKVGLHMTHRTGASVELGYIVQFLKYAAEAKETRKEAYEAMGKTSLYQEQIEEILQRVYPTPAVPQRVSFVDKVKADGLEDSLPEELSKKADLQYLQWEVQAKRLEEIRGTVKLRLEEFNVERSDYADTPWALWNAITEVENYRSGKKADYSVVFGPRQQVMARAFQELVKA